MEKTLTYQTMALLALVVAVAGCVRGVTGFGGAMVISPILAVIIGPQAAVMTALVMEAFAPLPLLPRAVRMTDWKTMGPIIAAVFVLAPIGGTLLTHTNPTTMRKAIAVILAVFSSLLLLGIKPRLGSSLRVLFGVGSVGGILVGATGMGGPPAIMYLLGRGGPVPQVRANLMVYVTLSSVAGLAAMSLAGGLNRSTLITAIGLVPVFMGASWLAAKSSANIDETTFRRATLLVLLSVSAAILFLS